MIGRRHADGIGGGGELLTGFGCAVDGRCPRTGSAGTSDSFNAGRCIGPRPIAADRAVRCQCVVAVEEAVQVRHTVVTSGALD